ncbi:MAG: ParB N-terminal domain-containing protein [Spirochaetia bacterium]|nr:ParB N-terminal domain-containing protein [Spirochaetota bacterium]MDW8111921.1 ParB N-terminal domain-containing protein [Spirochaetia bacterium]
MSLKSRIEFEKARARSKLNEIIMSLSIGANELFSLDEVKLLTKSYAYRYRGIQSIPLSKIKGSEGRYNDFDREFLPKHEGVRDKWENMMDFIDKTPKIPPIVVYKIGNSYIVRDGNHRVSVAKRLGLEYIDAEVIEMLTKFPIKELSEKELLLADAYHLFIEETHFDKVLPNAHIELTNPWGYITLIEHIKTYKYFVSERLGREVSIEEAVKDWYQNMFLKVTEIIKKKKLTKYFPHRTPDDIYIWIMDHWHYLKENTENPLLPIEKAIEDFEKFHQRIDISRIKKTIISLILLPIKLLYKFLRFLLKKVI